MIIRKLFKFEGAHIVRDCSSRRCKLSVHGHSYQVEVFFTADKLDNGGMIVDFGLLKGTIKDFVDSFDHCYAMWTKEKQDFKDFIINHSERWVEMPVTPSAEMLSLMFFYVINEITLNTDFTNGEGDVKLHSVRVHETDTGWAESFASDMKFFKYGLSDIIISDAIKDEWKDPLMWEKLIMRTRFINPIVELKYQ